MITPQYGIFAYGTHGHYFLEFDLQGGAAAEQALASFRRLRVPEVSAGGVNFVIAFGAIFGVPSCPSTRLQISYHSKRFSVQMASAHLLTSMTCGYGSTVAPQMCP